MQLKRISLSKVLKLELPELINGVIRIIEKHDPNHLELTSVLKLLKEHQQQMKLLKVRLIAQPLTPQVQQLREKELQCVGGIVSHMQFVMRADIGSIRHAANIANPVVKRFLLGLRKNNVAVITETIHQFLEYLDEHVEVYEALSVVGLRPFVDEIRKVNTRKIEMVDERDGRQLKRAPKVNSKLIQKKAQNDLDFVFDYIETNNYDHMPSYDSLNKELNVLLTRYATLINTRKTHNKNKSIHSKLNQNKPFNKIDPDDEISTD